MTDELMLEESVRAWVSEILPEEPSAANIAVAIAVRSYAEGASVSQARESARRFVQSWTMHPSHWTARGQRRQLAS